MKYFIANWKANKNLAETQEWIDSFLTSLEKNQKLSTALNQGRIKIIVAPPNPFLLPIREKIRGCKNLHLSCQNISHFEEGSITGEVTAKSLVGLIDFAIIGHSERRRYFNEKDDTLFRKVELAKQYELEPIFCVRNETDSHPDDLKMIAYEPDSAIGTGNNESLKNVLSMKRKLNLSANTIYIYGGSVNSKNISTYLSSAEIDGFLVGSASLAVEEFLDLIDLA